MKRFLTFFLAVLCCTVLVCCDKAPLDDPAPLNTTPEEGFPESAEVLYPEVEGTRIPFMTIGTVGAGNTDSQMLVLRNTDEVNAAIEQGVFRSIPDETKEMLLQKNFDLYQIVGIRYEGGAPYREVAELVLNGGALEVVRIRYINAQGHYHDGLYNHYVLCLIRKSDFGFPVSNPFDLNLWEHIIDIPKS